MKLCMIGTGYVGLVSGVCFSDLGNDVICVDRDQKKVKDLKKGIIPIYEPGLEELVLKNFNNKRLKFSTDLKDSVIKSDIIFICVGTPTKKNGNGADLSQIYNVAKEIRSSISRFKIIITKSTVSVTTGDEIEKIISNSETLHRETGHWGVPVFGFNNEPFFGQDRLDVLLWRLKQNGLEER